MSDAYQCDRCDDFETGSPPNTLKKRNLRSGTPIQGDGYLDEGEVELCKNCSAEFQRFMERDET